MNYYLYRAEMQWFWEQYAPCEADRAQITASPLRAGIDRLRGLPDTMLINGQADVLCSEGLTFGERLRCAGVDVTALRIQGAIHDFVMLNALDQTNACRTAMDASTAWIDRKSNALLNRAALSTAPLPINSYFAALPQMLHPSRHQVCRSVDREERPDVDAVYMEACLTMNGSGGWPLPQAHHPGTVHTDLYDGGGKDAIPFDKPETFFRVNLSRRSENIKFDIHHNRLCDKF